MIELSPKERKCIQHLFTNYPYLHGLVHIVIVGNMGRAFVDDLDRPTVARLHADFDIFAGDGTSDSAAACLKEMPRGSFLIVPDATWEQLVREIWGENLHIRQRVAFGPGQWDLNRLREFSQHLPEGFVLKWVTEEDAERFGQLSNSLVGTDPDTGVATLGGEIGFGVEHDGQFVSGCSGLPSDGKLEIEIQTHSDFRRRGLATAVAASMILCCIEHDIEPCWDAANSMSAGLGQKLGFTNPTPYNTYTVQ